MARVGLVGDQSTFPAVLNTTGVIEGDTLVYDSPSNTWLPVPATGGEGFNVMNYGAVGDGVTNDSTAIQAAITAAEVAGGEVYFPAATYICNGLTVTSNNVSFSGDGWSSILEQPTGLGDNNYLVTATTVDGFSLESLQLRGRVDTDGFEQFVHLVNLDRVSDFLAIGCLFKGFRGDGIYCGTTTSSAHNVSVKVLGCTFDGMNNENRNGISIIDGDDVLIEGCTFRNITESAMPGAIDIEPNQSYQMARNIKILNNHFDGIGGNAGVISLFTTFAQSAMTTPIQDILVRGNTIRNYTNSAGAIVFIQQEQKSSSTTANQIKVDSNIIDALGTSGIFGVEFDGMRDVQFTNNTLVNTDQTGVTFGWVYKSADVVFQGNRLRNICTNASSNNDCIAIFRCDRTTITDNLFDTVGVATPFGIIVHLNIDSGSSGTSDTIDFSRNEIAGSTATSVFTKASAHTVASTARVRAYDNRTNGITVESAIAGGRRGNLVTSTTGGTSGTLMGNATLVAGSPTQVTVTNSEVRTGDIILATHNVKSGTLGTLTIASITSGTSFVIQSSSTTDASTVFYEILH